MSVGQKVSTVLGKGVIVEVFADRYAVQIDGIENPCKLFKKDVQKCEN